ncbi:uncharacterized protein LOC144579355 isoform X3 [Callithrix jacchus]
MNWQRRQRRAGQAAAGPEPEPWSRLSGARRVTPPIHAALQPCPPGAAQAAAMATAPSLSARVQLINACKARQSQARPVPVAGPRAPAAAARLKFRLLDGINKAFHGLQRLNSGSSPALPPSGPSFLPGFPRGPVCPELECQDSG